MDSARQLDIVAEVAWLLTDRIAAHLLDDRGRSAGICRASLAAQRCDGIDASRAASRNVHRKDRREYPARLEEPSSDATHQVRRVRQNGVIKWQGDLVFVSTAMRRETIGLAETERGDWTVRFMHVELGRIDHLTRRFTPGWHGPRIGR